MNKLLVTTTIEKDKSVNHKNYQLLVYKDKWVTPEKVYLGKGQIAVVNCYLQPCIIETQLGTVDTTFQNGYFSAIIDGKDIENLYCSPLRQNGLLESILSKMRIHINEKTTMDF